jgi:hypothetical protein
MRMLNYMRQTTRIVKFVNCGSRLASYSACLSADTLLGTSARVNFPATYGTLGSLAKRLELLKTAVNWPYHCLM